MDIILSRWRIYIRLAIMHAGINVQPFRVLAECQVLSTSKLDRSDGSSSMAQTSEFYNIHADTIMRVHKGHWLDMLPAALST